MKNHQMSLHQPGITDEQFQEAMRAYHKHLLTKSRLVENWDSLDVIAEMNLAPSVFKKFLKYKEELKQKGHSWKDDAEHILRDFILEKYAVEINSDKS